MTHPPRPDGHEEEEDSYGTRQKHVEPPRFFEQHSGCDNSPLHLKEQNKSAAAVRAGMERDHLGVFNPGHNLPVGKGKNIFVNRLYSARRFL